VLVLKPAVSARFAAGHILVSRLSFHCLEHVAKGNSGGAWRSESMTRTACPCTAEARPSGRFLVSKIVTALSRPGPLGKRLKLGRKVSSPGRRLTVVPQGISS